MGMFDWARRQGGHQDAQKTAEETASSSTSLSSSSSASSSSSLEESGLNAELSDYLRRVQPRYDISQEPRASARDFRPPVTPGRLDIVSDTVDGSETDNKGPQSSDARRQRGQTDSQNAEVTVTEGIIPDHLDPRKKASQNSLINIGARENCAEYESALSDCFLKGGMWAKIVMCTAERKQFWKCFDEQRSILRTVGYGAVENSEDIDENLLNLADRRGQEFMNSHEQRKDPQDS